MNFPLYSLVTAVAGFLGWGSGPYTEVYWESWNVGEYGDYASQLEELNVREVGSGEGVNVVNVAFGNYQFGRDNRGRLTIGYVNEQIGPRGRPFGVDELTKAVDKIHENKGLVKLSFGGVSFPMGSVIKTTEDADLFAKTVAAVVEQDGFDGIDFDVEDNRTPSEIQIEVIKKCREYLGWDKLISYTTLPREQDDVLLAAASELSSINIMTYGVGEKINTQAYFGELIEKGIPAYKLVYGVMPGQHDNPRAKTTLYDAVNAAFYAKEQGMGGVMVWSINRDTDHRTGHSSGSNAFQTNQPDGTFVDAISKALAE